ncbi:sugar ABC transporter permease [Paenibacillus sp. V4I5]|uniref:ABC transporter permease n=1 Tax=Paenibacillus sp. V4I5 TaxID=3042306 RepID=UPI00278DB9B6|nr:ABC transporter permease subunit [Paenibacillus sp. V4I5]MDQ0920515.1 putative aldouronate transport system permease protein [Paenibacillus sp. V4I5]
MKQTAAVKKNGFMKDLIKTRTMWFMLLPTLLHVIVFAYIPMVGVVMAFKQYRYTDGILGSPWVGLDNFKFLFLSGQAFLITKNTLIYNLLFLVVGTFMQITLAIFLSEIAGKYFKKVTQSLMFLPYFISWVIVGSIAYNLFTYEYGALNAMLGWFGMKPLDVYNNPSYWPFILVFFNAWKTVGYGMVIYLASIISIDGEINQAAEIDGANIFQRIRYVTLPSILPTIIILVLLAVGGIFRGDFGLFYQLIGDNGLLRDSTDIIDTFVFRSLTQTSEIGMAAAAGFYQSIMCFIMIIFMNDIVKRLEKDYALF